MSFVKLYRSFITFLSVYSRSTFFRRSIGSNAMSSHRVQLKDTQVYVPTSPKVLQSPYNDVHISHHSLAEFIWKDVHRWSKKVAIQSAETGEEYTYGTLRELCARFARALERKGFRRGQVLCLVLPNIPQFLVVLMGAIEAGLVVTTLNPEYTPDELAHQIEDSGTVVVVTLTTLADRLRTAIEIVEEKTNGNRSISMITVGENTPGVESSYDEMVSVEYNVDSDVEVGALPENLVVPDDLVLLPYSSGTTGLQKGVQLTHANLMYNLLQLNQQPIRSVQESNTAYQDIVPAVLPFFHIFGISALILTSLVNGCKIISFRKFDPQKYLHVLIHEYASVLYLVPSLAAFLANVDWLEWNDLQFVRIAFFAGGSTRIEDIQKLVWLSGERMRIRHAYGLTEASPAVSVSGDYDALNSSGQLLPNTWVKIIDEHGNLLDSHQRGEICVRGPQVMRGYLNNPEATADVIDAEGFLHTGDVGYYNTSGSLFCVDRIKELIKVKGFQVAPVELESIIKAHRHVKDAGVIGVPDERCGEKPVAFVVVKDEDGEDAASSQRISEEDVKRYVAERVAPYKQLASVVFVDCIPRNPSGKILRRILRENYSADSN